MDSKNQIFTKNKEQESNKNGRVKEKDESVRIEKNKDSRTQ